MVAFRHQGEMRVTAGCRRGYTIAEAREHWSLPNIDKWTVKTPEYGERQLRMVDFLEAEAKALGWVKAVEVAA